MKGQKLYYEGRRLHEGTKPTTKDRAYEGTSTTKEKTSAKKQRPRNETYGRIDVYTGMTISTQAGIKLFRPAPTQRSTLNNYFTTEHRKANPELNKAFLSLR